MRSIGTGTSASRCSFHDTIGKTHRAGTQGIPRDRRTSHPETRHRPVLERKVVGRERRFARCGGTIVSERRCWDRSAECICLGAEIDWRKLFPAEATAIKLPIIPVPIG